LRLTQIDLIEASRDMGPNLPRKIVVAVENIPSLMNAASFFRYLEAIRDPLGIFLRNGRLHRSTRDE
jgi:hypothetical protein